VMPTLIRLGASVGGPFGLFWGIGRLKLKPF
jgi:hypothetical protein